MLGFSKKFLCNNVCTLIPLHDHYLKNVIASTEVLYSDVPHFSLLNGLPHDMHDVLEGVVRELSLLLKHCVSSEYLTLEYNHRLLHFDYDYTETDRPTPILRRSMILENETRV